MKLDSQGSQFTSVGSQRAKHVPDVLFVDEEGNPIEAGHENLIYVDEQGNEIPEEIAQQLLESGKYIDSRDLYLAADAVETQSGVNTTATSSVGGEGGGSRGQIGGDLTQPSLPASAFGSLSKSTGANEMANMVRKSSYQSIKSAAEEEQRAVFAQAQAKIKQREDELREIEADAAAAASAAFMQQQQQQPPQSVGFTNKSMSNTDMQKSHSGRRLLQPPPLKNSQDFKSSESMARRQQPQPPPAQSDRPASSQQVFDLHQLINSNSGKIVMDQRQLEAQRASQQQLSTGGVEGVEGDEQNVERVRSRQGRSSRKSRQQTVSQQQGQPQYIMTSDGGSYYEVTGGAEQTDGETGDDVQSQLTEQHILEMREQQMLREKLLRKQQEYLEQQQEYARQRRHQQSANPYEDDILLQQQAQDETTAGEETGTGTDDEYFRQLSRNFTQSVGSTNMMSPRQPVGAHHHHHHHRQRHSHQQVANANSSSSAAIVSTSAGSQLTQPINLSHATRNQLRDYLKDFHVEQVRHVGSLSGKNVIYSLGKIDLGEFDRFYSSLGDEASFTSSSRVGDNGGLVSSGIGLSTRTATAAAAATANSTLNGIDEIDPYDPNLFKDEIIDIDFGAIDAYTAGLNAQINAEKANQSANNSSGLQFPSHILTSNHATFIDNQMLLGDPFYSQTSTANNLNGHESSSNLNGNNQNGMNVQFFSSVNDLQQSEGGGSFGAGFDVNTQSQLNTQSQAGVGASSGGGGVGSVGGDYCDGDLQTGVASTGGVDQYSPSNSFGSMVDIQSQQTYSIGDLNQLSQIQQQNTQQTQQQSAQQDFHSSSYQPSTTTNNYYCGESTNNVVDYTNQYQQTSNSIANIASGSKVMRNSFTNSSAIYNVNNYIGR